jgi:hypothetical protein
MSTDAYREVLNKVLDQVQKLTFEEQLQLLEDLVRFIRLGMKEIPLHNVMEFEGIAKESWEGVDVAKYIDEERNSWDR